MHTQRIQEVYFRIGWIVFATFMVAGAICLMFSVQIAFAFFGIAFLHLGTCLHEIKDPDIGMLFRMGHLVGKLSPGWYLTIPHIWDVVRIPTSWKQIDIKGDMYTNQQTLVEVKARVFYRASENGLAKIVRMMPDEMEKRAEVVALAVLRGEVGTKDFKGLVSEKDTMEGAAKQRLVQEFSRYGYVVRDFEIYDFNEKVWSEAERVKALGKARGEVAKALAEPLKDNYPAAAVNAVTIIAETAEKIAETVWSGTKKTEGSGHKNRSSGSKQATMGERLAKAIDNLIGERS